MKTRQKLKLDGTRRPSPKGYWTKDEHDQRRAKKRALRERQRKFKNAKPLSEQQVQEMIAAHMELHGVIVCPPAYLAPTRALELTRAPEPPVKTPKRRR